MTKEEAKILAVKFNRRVNACEEYEGFFRFYDRYAKEEKTGDDSVVVLKSTGKVMNLTTFILNYHPSFPFKK
jgi:hypothetical protein